MSSAIFTPSNQVKLTNVSVVRLKKAGLRFELACYKNKVLDYRTKITKSLDDILQIHQVFTNVSKGQLAPKEDLLKAFGHTEVEKIIVEILERGEIQVSGKEREYQADSLHKEVATIIADKCINPSTRTPYPPSLIEKALADIHFAPNPNKSAKQQALEAIRSLGKVKGFPIARARMRLLVELPREAAGERCWREVAGLVSKVEEELQEAGAIRATVLVEPCNYKRIGELVSKTTKGAGTVHTLSLKEVRELEEGYL